MANRQIIAMGGGGFSMDPDNMALDRYVLAQTRRERPRVCFLPTASGDADSYLLNFYQSFARLDCHPSHLSLFKPHTADLRGFVLEQDVIYVGGGNTRSMLVLWREWGMDEILREAYAAGVILAGISAGGNCWFEQCSTDSNLGRLSMLPALGFLPGSFTPHYDGEAERRPSLHAMLRAGEIMPGLAAEDGAAVHFVDDALLAAVSERPQARVYQVGLRDSEVIERPLEMIFLGAPD